MRLRRPPAVALILVVAAASACCAAEEVPRPKSKIPVGRETTFVDGPLDAEGYVDFAGALNEHYGRGVTPENNACVLFWEAIGPKAHSRFLTKEYFAALGMRRPPNDGNYFVSHVSYLIDRGEAYDERAFEDLEKRLTSGPWKAADHPQAAEWLAANEGPLKRIEEASRRPRYHTPILGGNDVCQLSNPIVETWEEIARTFLTRIMSSLGEGRQAAARDDVLTLLRLGRLLQSSYDAAGTPYYLESNANWGLQAVLRHGTATADELRTLLEAVDAVRPMVPLWERHEWERRLGILDHLQRLARGDKEVFERHRPLLDHPWSLARSDYAKMDFGEGMRVVNRRFDEAVTILRRKTHVERDQAIDAFRDRVRKAAPPFREQTKLFGFTLDHRPPRNATEIADWLSLEKLNGMKIDSIMTVRVERDFEQARVALGLAIYRAAFGEYPEKLADLRRREVMTPAVDLCCGEEFRYRRTPDGYFLYSVGFNGIDDGGRTYVEYRALSSDERKKIVGEWDDFPIEMPPKK
jgi:hypothetical protein